MDHPNIARLLDVYEDEKLVHIVMEFCSGKELYHRLVKRNRYSERDAARTTYEMLLAINYLHQHNVVHRDIKLENFLYEDPSETARLKLIDFGFSKLWYPTDEDCRLKASCGSIQYVAPEVLRGQYDEKCDMWSAGVIVFMLLSGEPPFDGFEDDVLENIKRCNYSFNSKRWKSISETGKDFVQKLLIEDPQKRMSAIEALNHPWIKTLGNHEDVEVPTNVLEDLRSFASANHLRRAALSMLAYSLTSDEINELHEVFLSIDHNKEGTISLQELVDVMKDRLSISEEEIGAVFGKMDRSHQGKIQYTTFLAATMASRIRLHDNLIRHVFQQLDADNNGTISLDDLRTVLGPTIEGEDIAILLAEADTDGNGRIDYEDFENAFNMTDPIPRSSPSINDAPPGPLVSLDRQRSIKMAMAKLRAVSALSRATSTKTVDDHIVSCSDSYR
jgi:calcium-dependent protein kinase